MLFIKNIHNKTYGAGGFTMIELLIVMAIIGILASISGFALQNARRSGRDARRKSDLESIRSALELHKADCNVYPPALNWGNQLTGSCNANIYMERVPADPNTSWTYEYNVGIPAVTYDLCAAFETDDINAGGSCGTCNAGANGCDYRVEEP